ncbi:MAG: histone deacetylase, partial [Gammaproteobacteria bacterium]|nr:histone deacetylase [Gammaproteobacteria bacterium]
MKVFYCDQFVLPLPPTHRFPMDKYRRLRDRIQRFNDGRFELRVPAAANPEQLALAHCQRYIGSVFGGHLDRGQLRALGFPWSEQLVERSRRSVGATVEACRAALADGAAASLAGGTHHAFADRPQGFCVFNDAAVALRTMQREGRIERAIVVDCDVHQGNGTAAIFRDDPSVYTFSIHGRNNFPYRKEHSDLDVALPDRVADKVYVRALAGGLRRAFSEARADLVIYIAGADPYIGDRWGRMSITKAGLAERDRTVYRYCRQWRLPVVVVMAGGYARNIDDIVDIHFESVRLV